MNKKTLLKISLLAFILAFFPVSFLSAQQQSGTFSGNDPESYSCYNRTGTLITDSSGNALVPQKDESKGLFYCNTNSADGYQACSDGIYDDGETCDAIAVLKPPTVQQLEVWFVRIVYAIWAIAASFSFIGILIIGYQYMISRGAPEATVRVKDRIAKFLLGFCLVFLAVPILNTVFRVLSVNDSIQCYQGLTSNVGIGFQFFFPTLCTDPTGNVSEGIVTDPCSSVTSIQDLNGLLCPSDYINSTSTCNLPIGPNGGINVFFRCIPQSQSNGSWCYEYRYADDPNNVISNTCN